MDWMSNWFLCSIFSDRLIPEMLLLMEVANDGEVEVPPMSELGFDEYDSWKGVEGCVEAVLSAIVRLLVRVPRRLA